MTPDESIRFAAVIASLVSVLATILLFLFRELIDRRRRRVKSATTLALYSTIIVRALQRNSLTSLPFGMKEVLEAASDVVQVPESASLLENLEECVFILNGAAATKTPLQREERERLITNLIASRTAHTYSLRIAVPIDVASLPAISET